MTTNLVDAVGPKTTIGKKSKKIKDWEDPDRDNSNDLMVTKKAFFQIEIDDEPVGKVVISLFGETCPVTVQNFAALVRGTSKNRERLSYNDTVVHRIVSDFVIQMGDVTEGDGTGGISIYGKYFDDENFYLRHAGPGWVAMANSGPDTNNSQFFILLTKAGWLDGRHVVFGKVTEGMDIVEKISQIDTDDADFPLKPVRVIDSGIIPVRTPFILTDSDGDQTNI
ncbi:peptidyl-prolyl cis-trans isomerase B-like [Asterias rubens]|uniref:peptidyl-prolyl cis-trans isomerase B-like n=1 Tax=Asterias rubens TaxID=7604 RepID=UPI001454F957|nr:peptidyl-prolyl cis-trans isomerase B-like [Asterias rubens]